MNIPLNIDWQQILLHLFNFSILAGGLYLLLFKPVKNFMDKRAKHYADMESAAVEREKNTAALEASMQQRQAALDAELDEKRAAAAREAETYAHQQRVAAHEQADKIVAAAARTRRTTAKRSWTRPTARPCPSPRPPWRSCWRRRLPAPMTRS